MRLKGTVKSPMRLGCDFLKGALLGLGLLLQAQGPGRMFVHSYGGAQGLPDVRINAMIQDRQGRYWVAGDTGVYLGDGSIFLRIRPSPTEERPYYRALVEDAAGGIYLAGPSGLWYLRDDTWHPVGQGLPELAPEEPVGLFRDGEQRLWLQWGARLFRVEGPGRYVPIPLPSEGRAYLSQRPRAPGLLVRIGARGWRWEAGAWSPLPVLPLRRGEEYRAAIQEDARGTLWTGTYLRIFRLDPSGRAWRTRVDSDGNQGFAGGTASPGGISSPDPGEIWAMGDQVARRLDRPEPALETNASFSTFSMRLLLRDREGHLWVDRDGLHRVGGPWRVHGGLDGLPVSGVWQALRDPLGRLWISTTLGLYRTVGTRWEKVWSSGLHAQIVLGADRHVWAVERLSGRILRFDALGRGTRPAPLPAGLQGVEGIRGFSQAGPSLAFPTRDQRVLLGTWREPAWDWQSIPSPVPAASLRTFSDPRGKLHVLGKDGAGRLLHSFAGGPWIPLPPEIGRDLTDLQCPSEGTLIAARFTPPELHTLHLRNGQWERASMIPLERFSPCKTAYGFAQLEDGRTWVITDHGVLELDPKHPDRARHFTSRDGLPLDDCNQFGLLIEKDHIWVSTGTGLASYDRRAERPLPDLPAPYLLGAKVGEAPWSLALPREVPPGTRAFSLQIGIPTPARQPHLRYQWQDLERGGEWHEFEAPTLTFLDPGPGAHRLRVRALEPGNHASPEWACDILVLRPWWQRAWAVGLWGGLAAGLFLSLHRLRLRRIETRSEELAILVADRTAALAASEERERAASRAKSAFLADMSHELRTPLNAILLYSELIHLDAEEAGHESLTRDSGRILSSGQHLLSLINGILDLSKVEAGKMQIRLERLVLRPMLDEILNTLGPLALQQKNRIEVELPEEDLEFRTDGLKLKQILINLAGNAIKFTEEGVITFAARREGAEVHLEVRDTGVGLSAEQIARLFQAYEQPQANAPGVGSTGLGLTISKRFVELLGGRIEVTSAPGRGSIFHIHLPEVEGKG